MGALHLGGQGVVIDIEDHLLHHIKLVTVAKLRRDEPFLLSWQNPPETPGRHSVWIHREADMHFVFDNSEPPHTDQKLLDVLSVDSLKALGLELWHFSEHDTETGQLRLLPSK
ncbi:MAG TPA: hypothetical protein VNT53_11240 [Pseudolysinimonas sp.]|nr:hypothetical protein [Pseudolysinimonas sp.]